MKLWKRFSAIFVALALLIGAIPVVSVGAAVEEVYPTTWEELRDALQSSGFLQVRIPQDVTITYTFDSTREDYRDVQINVVGEKRLYIYGEIQFVNSLNNGKGLINLDSSDDDLSVSGSSVGEICYSLEKGDSPTEGDLFYLTAGSLYLGGYVNYEVSYGFLGETVEAHQAVIGGTGGEVTVWTSILRGNTIFGDGVNFTFQNGYVRGYSSKTEGSYLSVDLYMRKGHATFEGGLFWRGIGWEGDADSLMTLPDDVVCVDLRGTDSEADKDYILKFTPCSFHRLGFYSMEPAMPELSTNCALGTIGVGETQEIRVMTRYQNPSIKYTKGNYDKASIDVYRGDESIYYQEVEGGGEELTYSFENAQAGDYQVWISLSLMKGSIVLRKETYRYTLTVTDTIRRADVSLDKTDLNGFKGNDIVDVSDVTWYEQNRSTGAWTANPASLRDGFTYAAEFKLLAIGGKYAFADDYKVFVNGEEATRTSSGKWRIEYTKTGYLTRIEMYDIALPTPGQHPDFIAHKDNPPYSYYEVVWTPYIDGEFGEPLTATDVFEDNTSYLLEVVLTAEDDFEFDYYTDDNGAYAYINDKKASVYYPDPSDRSVIVAYTYYNTKYCVSQVEIIDVQYPIPGRTPDTDVVVSKGVHAAGYADGSTIEWYYETNPGTSAAGFSKLDGKFKADRRHQAYVKLETESGYWFATDSQGRAAVNVTFDGEPMAFAYVTDTDSRLGYNEIEVAHTYEMAKDVDGVFIDGMWLQDGLYMDSEHWGVRTEDTVDKEAGYAYYEDGVLTLHDFEWRCWGDYNAIDSYHPLTIVAEGYNEFADDPENMACGIVTSSPLTLCGDGEAAFSTDNSALFALDEVTVESGEWRFYGNTYDGVWLGNDLTVNGGLLQAYGKQCGLYGDDWPTVTVNGGTLVAYTDDDYAIGWCDVQIADGANVYVRYTGDTDYTNWDGVTSFEDYGVVWIKFPEEEPDVLKGDVDGNGDVDIYDALRLFKHVNEELTLEGSELAAGDVDGNGDVDIYDALRLFKYVNEEIDSLS